MKPKSIKTEDGIIKFDHFYVKKKSDNYFAVCDNGNQEITSGESMGNACKKARLLEIGYQQAQEIYCEWYGVI